MRRNGTPHLQAESRGKAPRTWRGCQSLQGERQAPCSTGEACCVQTPELGPGEGALGAQVGAGSVLTAPRELWRWEAEPGEA